jgi:hypothetical protein
MAHPVLDDIELPLVQEITTQDRRVLSEQKPPGMSGSLIQNMGRRLLRIVVSGVATGPNALATAEKLDEKFKAAKPVPFTADIDADSNLDLVLIEELRLQELAGMPLRISYVITLREFVKPVESAPTPGAATGLDGNILGDALDRLQGIADNIAAAQALATGLERFLPQFSALLAQLQAAAKP